MPRKDSYFASQTPARIDVGRAGARALTETLLKFRADHALARDAVNSELSVGFLQKMIESFAAVCVQTSCADRHEFVRFPPKGRVFSEETLAALRSACIENPDVQIVMSDGLSARAVESNLPDLLKIIEDGLKLEKFSTGTPVIVKQGRVAAADQIAFALGAKLVINLIGERPGLSSAESLSAYITLNPGPQTISSDRTVISNIHRGGTPPLEAGAYAVQLVKKIFEHKLSGVKLQLAEGRK